MKTSIFVVLAFCLVFSHASVVREDPIERSVRSLETYAESLNEKADQIVKEVEVKYEDIILQPTERIEASAMAIDERRQESDECVDQQASAVDAVLSNFENVLDSCAQDASSTGLPIANNIALTSAEISYDSYKLVKGVQRCRRYTNSVLKNTCYARQLIKAKILLSKTINAVDSLNTTVDESFPAMVNDLEQCSASAEQNAQAQLDLINRNIDSCISAL